MSEYSTSQRSPSVARPTRTTPQRPERRVTPTEFAQWLEGRLPSLQVRWTERIRSTGRMRGDVWDGLIADFVVLITSTLPTLLGPHRDEVEPLWVRAAELFGTAASRRGLAAGEAVEELQILRQVLDDAGAGGRRRETALGWNLSEGSTTSSESLSSESGGREEEQGGEDRPGSGVSFSDFVEPV